MSWAFIENVMGTGITAIISIILANLLSPREFGLVGMIAIFITLSSAIMDSGFSGALIRKEKAHHGDYCTVFFTNLALGILLYLVLFFTAPAIASFLHEPLLTDLIRTLGLSVIILAFSQVQKVRFTRELNFRTQAIVALGSSLFSGIVSILMAIKGYGVWSLVAQQLCKQIATSLLFWILSSWKPSMEFSKKSFGEMFGFGSKLVLSSVINAIWSEIYAFAMGKFFTPTVVGLYSRADKFKSMVTTNIGIVSQKVGYPVLSQISDEKERQRRAYRKMVRSTVMLISTLVAGLMACAPSLIEVLIGKQWLPCSEYLRILALSGLFLPMMLMAVNIFNANGKSSMTLIFEVIKTLLAAPPILLGVLFGIKAMLWGIVASTGISYLVHVIYVAKELRYGIWEQIADILPYIAISAVMGSAVYLIEYYTAPTNIGALPLLAIQVAAGVAITLFIYQNIYKSDEYVEMRDYILSVLHLKKGAKDGR